jgi:ParB-like chromosome segregation protein Spo0J
MIELSEKDEGITRDERAESLLSSYEIRSATLVRLDLDRIDTARGLKNQARINPVDNETVLKYTRAVKDGSQFPPILCRQISETEVYPLDGNHRIGAYQAAGIAQIETYLIRCTDDLARSISFASNTLHGMAPSHVEVHNEIRRLLASGVADVQIERNLKVSRHLIANLRRSDDVTLRCAAMGLKVHSLKEFQKFTFSTLDDETLKAVIQAILSYPLQASSAECTQLSQAIKAAQSHDQKMQAINWYKIKWGGNQEVKKDTKSKKLRGLQIIDRDSMRLIRVLNSISIGTLTPVEQAQALDQLREVQKSVNAYIKTLVA